MDPEMELALTEREKLITERAVTLAHQAAGERNSWAARALPSSADAISGDFLERLTVVAAYRDRYGVTGPDPLGAIPDADAQRVDYERARSALVALRGAHDAPPDSAAPSRRGPVRDAR
jgi:hypothetical protein